MARLERLEAIATAIAAHLGVALPGGTPGPARRLRVAQAGAAVAGYEIVRTVARGLLGRVKLYNAARGYGFITSPDASGDVFFHRRDCPVDPATFEHDAEVAFDLVEMVNGQVKAIHVSPRREAHPASSASRSGRVVAGPRLPHLGGHAKRTPATTHVTP